MRVVIVTSIPFWHPGTSELVSNLKKSNIEVVAIDFFNAQLYNEHGKIQYALPHYIKGFFRKVSLYLFRNRFFKKHVRTSDIVDIHFVDAHYVQLVPLLPPNQTLICTLFGSDIYRISDSLRPMQQELFKRANRIQLSENMKPYFNEKYPGNESKFYLNQYGSSRIDETHQVKKAIQLDTIYAKYQIDSNKIVVCCGYNAKEEQQHEMMLDALSKLPIDFKNKIHLLFPFTYGAKKEYIEQITQQIKQCEITYTILTNRLNDIEIAEIRLLCAITLNMQTTDALASSIKEAFVADSILIVGKWLPYNLYRDLGLYYIDCEKKDLASTIQNVLENIKSYKSKVKGNDEKILQFASWQVITPQWIKMYNT